MRHIECPQSPIDAPIEQQPALRRLAHELGQIIGKFLASEQGLALLAKKSPIERVDNSKTTE